jgi:hypothetical protein
LHEVLSLIRETLTKTRHPRHPRIIFCTGVVENHLTLFFLCTDASEKKRFVLYYDPHGYGRAAWEVVDALWDFKRDSEFDVSFLNSTGNGVQATSTEGNLHAVTLDGGSCVSWSILFAYKLLQKIQYPVDLSDPEVKFMTVEKDMRMVHPRISHEAMSVEVMEIVKHTKIVDDFYDAMERAVNALMQLSNEELVSLRQQQQERLRTRLQRDTYDSDSGNINNLRHDTFLHEFFTETDLRNVQYLLMRCGSMSKKYLDDMMYYLAMCIVQKRIERA